MDGNTDDVVSAAASDQHHVDYTDDEHQPSIANGSVRHIDVDYDDRSLSACRYDNHSMTASVRTTSSKQQQQQRQQPSLDGYSTKEGDLSDTVIDDLRYRKCTANDDDHSEDCGTLASDVEHRPLQSLPSFASSQRDDDSAGDFGDRSDTCRDDDALSASTAADAPPPAAEQQQLPAAHAAENATNPSEVVMLPVGSGDVVFRKRLSIVAADGSLNTVTQVRVQQAAAAAAANNHSDDDVAAEGSKFYALPNQDTQPDFNSLVKLASHIKQDCNMNEVSDEDDGVNDNEIFPIVEISVQGGVCKVRETIGRRSRVNIFTDSDVAVIRRGSQEATISDDEGGVRRPMTSDAMTNDAEPMRCDDSFDVGEREPGSGCGSINGDFDRILSSNDGIASSSAYHDADAAVNTLRTSDGAAEDMESVIGEGLLVGSVTEDIQSVPDAGVDRWNDSASDGLAAEPIDHDIDDAVAMKRDGDRRRRRDDQRRSRMEEEEERMMSELLWKLAMKQLKPNDWKELAKYWQFTDDHIFAIQQQYTGKYTYIE